MPAPEKKVVVSSPVSADRLVLAALLFSLFIDLVPRFHLGDSLAFIYTRYGAYLPEDRSWLYGLVLSGVTQATGELFAMPLLQILVSWAAYAFLAITLTKALGLQRRMALVIVAIGALEPLGYYWSRAFMADSLAQSAFVFLCGVLLLRCHLALRFALVFVAGFLLISLRVVYFPAVLLALLAAAAWSAWNAWKPASAPDGAHDDADGAGVRPGPDGHSARSWAVAAVAIVAANLTFAVANTQLTHAQKLTTNVANLEFLVAALSPLGGDQLDFTPLTPAERSGLLPLTYENRNGSMFNPKGLVPLIRGHYKTREDARSGMRRFLVNVAIHHPVRLAGLVLRQWGDYLNPVKVWTYHRRGYWSGANDYGQSIELPQEVIQLFRDWKVWTVPPADLPARNSPALWYFKRAGGVWSLALALCGTLSFLSNFLLPRVYRTSFLVFSTAFALLYMAEIALASVDLLSRYLMPISAPLLYMIAIAIHARWSSTRETAPAAAQPSSSAAAAAMSQARKAAVGWVGARLFGRTSQ